MKIFQFIKIILKDIFCGIAPCVLIILIVGIPTILLQYFIGDYYFELLISILFYIMIILMSVAVVYSVIRYFIETWRNIK